MIPEQRFSSQPVRGTLYNPWTRDPLLSQHWGPIALQDPSEGLGVKLWQLRTLENGELLMSAPDVPEFEWYDHGVKLDRLGLAFDQNGRPVVVFTDIEGGKFLRWFDPVPNAIVTVAIDYATSPCVTLDDNRSLNLVASDVILAYVRDGVIRYRQQRDRFLDEYTPPIGVGGSPATAEALFHVSMNSALRLEFITDGNGDDYWSLADIVTDLLMQSNVQPEHIDVRQLQSTIVEGYRIGSQGGADVQMSGLQLTWAFDPGEWDKKIHFIKRGGEPVAHLTFDDLLERTNELGPMSIERVQEVELLRKVNVTMVDSTIGWIPNKQTAERRSATIVAVGESSVVIPVTGTPDLMAEVANRRLRIPWGEPNKFRFKNGLAWAELTPTDVFTMTDRRGRAYRMRLSMSAEDYGVFEIEANSDAYYVYGAKASGVQARPNRPTIPGQAGNTNAIVLDIPVFRDQDDLLGYYVAVAGSGPGWSSGILQISLDGGATIAQSISVDSETVFGTTVTALLPEVSSEYLSDQTLRVNLPAPPASVDREDILRYRNLAAIQHSDGTWEVMQYQTVTPVSDGVYDLTDLVRGRYATKPLEVDVGAHFVLIHDSMMFAQIQEWMLGQTISYRAITTGQNPDDVAWQTMTATNPQTQVEWPVHYAKAIIDPAGNLKLSWIGRGRLGVEISPRHSQFFRGYRVTFSDGVTVTTLDSLVYRANTPIDLESVTIEPMNYYTGAGPAVTVVPVAVPKVTIPGIVIDGGEVAP